MPLHVEQPIESSSLSEKVYTLLYEQIVQGHLAPGEKLEIPELARALHVSRTPVKEAINHLAQQGLVRVHSRVGTFVTTLDLNIMRELFDVRLMMELWGAERGLQHPASLNLERMAQTLEENALLFSSAKEFDYQTFMNNDSDFHICIVDAAQNSQLSRLYRSLNAHIQLMRVYWGRARVPAERSHTEHMEIFKAIEQANPCEVKKALRVHILNTRDDLTGLFPLPTPMSGE